MGTYGIAKGKIEELRYNLEESKYNLKYKSQGVNILDTTLYNNIKGICDTYLIPFPFIKENGKILLDLNKPDVYKTLTYLAEKHNIIIDLIKIDTV